MGIKKELNREVNYYHACYINNCIILFSTLIYINYVERGNIPNLI